MSQVVLLLNADCQPLSYLPFSTLSWQAAVKLMCLDVATVLHSYDDWFVHSPSTTMQVPAVMMMRDHVDNIRIWKAHERTAPQRHLLFLRDFYQCQYCEKRFPRRQLTIDHVLPRKLGGQTKWENLATACGDCNGRRGCDITIQPKNKPFRPTFGQLLRNMRQFPIAVPHETWTYYLNWSSEKVRLRHPRDENFDFGMPFDIEL